MLFRSRNQMSETIMNGDGVRKVPAHRRREFPYSVGAYAPLKMRSDGTNVELSVNWCLENEKEVAFCTAAGRFTSPCTPISTN
jgi:hypothetical protein